MVKWLIVLVLLLSSAYWFFSSRDIRHPPGIIAPDEPTQTMIKSPENWQERGYTFTPLAEYSGKLRVLHTRHYTEDRAAELSPVDLAVGWGSMSDQAVIDGFSITQNGRWFYFSWSGKPPIDPNEVYTHAANTHMIPANKEIERTLLQVRAGNIVEFSGVLVSVLGPDGYRWVSSLSRSDTGSGACEVLYVKSLKIK